MCRLHPCTRSSSPTRSVIAAALLCAAATLGVAQSPAAAPAPVTSAQFRGLRWLDGDWRGRLPGGGYFYERYAMANDSTIEMRRFRDSTFAPGASVERVALRAGVVRYNRAVATRVDSSGIAFRADPPSRNGFTFERAGADRWTATIRNVDRTGRERTIVYRMERYTIAAAAQGGDRAAVRRAVLDYVEGFYEGDTAKLVRSVWPEVRKYGYARRQSGGGYQGMAMPFPAGFMRYAEGVRAGRGTAPPNAPKEIDVFDVQDQTASAKLTAWWGTDYLLLARENGRWMITHVLWQSPPAANAARGGR